MGTAHTRVSSIAGIADQGFTFATCSVQGDQSSFQQIAVSSFAIHGDLHPPTCFNPPNWDSCDPWVPFFSPDGSAPQPPAVADDPHRPQGLKLDDCFTHDSDLDVPEDITVCETDGEELYVPEDERIDVQRSWRPPHQGTGIPKPVQLAPIRSPPGQPRAIRDVGT